MSRPSRKGRAALPKLPGPILFPKTIPARQRATVLRNKDAEPSHDPEFGPETSRGA